jgi:hypothetical protein
MPGLLAAVEFGGYLSPVKTALFLLLVFGWLPILNWVYRDTEAVGTKQIFWTAVVFGDCLLYLAVGPHFFYRAAFISHSRRRRLAKLRYASQRRRA